MILCVSLNAAVDKTIVVSPFRLNEIHRPQQVMTIPGGKACNIARALKRFGESPVISGFVGGFAGQFIEARLHDEGLATDFVHMEHESRMCISILDSENHTLTEVYENGDPVSEDHLDAFKRHFASIVAQHSMVALSGSLPPGVPADIYRQLIEIARDHGIPAVLDASGAALREGIQGKPLLVKPNKKEFAELVGQVSDDVSALVRGVVKLAGVQQTGVVLSLGADGAIATDGKEVLHVRPPTLAVKSAVGSGDSLLAGIIHGLTHGFSFEDAVRYGVAAGSANALTLGAAVFTLDDLNSVLGSLTVTRY